MEVYGWIGDNVDTLASITNIDWCIHRDVHYTDRRQMVEVNMFRSSCYNEMLSVML